MTASLRFRQLSIRDFRNVATIDIEPAPRFNVIAGDNGVGKTSVIEALYFVSTTRSFRADKLREMIRQDRPSATVRGVVDEAGLVREHRGVLTARARSIQLDGKRPARLAHYATLTPVVVFHPGDLGLVSGAASGRRRLLDRVALFVDPTSGDHRQRYDRAQRARQTALEARGTRAADLEPFERLMAAHGAALGRARRLAAEQLESALRPAFERMLVTRLPLAVSYEAGGTEDVEAFAAELGRRRADDLRRRSATFGPQRDDLVLMLDGRTARRHGSQGQQRILTLALKIAELECVRQARDAHPILLLDDVSSELDPTRTGAVYEYLRATASQVFVTTTRPELFETPGVGPDERVDWRLADGAILR